MENNKMFKSLYDRILSVKFLNTVLIGCAVMGEACSLSHPITDMTTKEKGLGGVFSSCRFHPY